MNNPIDKVFQATKSIKIMTHVIAGYPDLKTSKELILYMANQGVDMIEIQIPFSDPLADGPTIMAANQTALDHGTNTDHCLQMVSELRESVDIPLLFMTYGNIAFAMGMETFISRTAASKMNGLIIPDIPFDERHDNYLQKAREKNLHPIHVISPDIKIDRLQKVLEVSTGFIYTTLKVGITGARNEIDPQGLDFINTIKEHTSLPVAAGFGISSPEQVKQLQGLADMAVIGSHFINLYDQYGKQAIGEFITRCKT